jgi:iron complex transport system permease protein
MQREGGVVKFGLFLLVCLLFATSLIAGKSFIPPSAWCSTSIDGFIMAELRLPRAILGACIGAVLGLSGAVLQGYLRNPLADPSIVGVSSSAAMGGVFAIFFGLSVSPFGLFASAMGGALLSILLLMNLGGKSGGPLGFILAGMVLSTLAGSITAFLISVAPNPYATSEIVTWLMGALTDRGWSEVMTGLPFMILGGGLLLTTGAALDALSLGEDTATTLGVDHVRLRWTIAIGIGLAVGASVAVTGVVGFVGLITPHFVRMMVGERPSAILVPSALGGAILVLAADSLVRLTPGASEVRLGVAMSILGAPFFFLLLARIRSRAI